MSVGQYKTPSGKKLWRVLYRRPDGRQTCKRGFARKRDAQNWMAEHVTVAKARGGWVDPQAGRATVGSLWPAWIAKKRVSSKPSYVESLERAWRVHVEPKWAARALSSISRQEVQEWVADQSASRSATVVLRNLGILRGICADAARDRLIVSNPCDGMETPKKTRRRHTYLTAEQLVRLAEASGSRRAIVLVLGLTGIRWGEMAGLHVEDVDFARRRLSVRRSATTVGGKVVVGTPKSGSARQVAFPSALEPILREACGGRDGEEPLFPGSDGGYAARTAHPSDPTKWFYRAKEAAGVPLDLTYHDLRHTAASLMVSAGANVKAVQNQLGHASASMTLDVYADLFDDDLDSVADSMDRMLSSGNVVRMLSRGDVGDGCSQA